MGGLDEPIYDAPKSNLEFELKPMDLGIKSKNTISSNPAEMQQMPFNYVKKWEMEWPAADKYY